MDKISAAFAAWWLRYWLNAPNPQVRSIAVAAFEAGWTARGRRSSASTDTGEAS